jgi:hypothetical protein
MTMMAHTPPQEYDIPARSYAGSARGPNTFPAMRELRQVPDAVSLPQTEVHREAIMGFTHLLHLMQVPVTDQQLPQLDSLREAHPGDTEGFVRLSHTYAQCFLCFI